MITIPTLQQLQSDIQADLESKFGTTLPTSGKNFLRVLTTVQAGCLWLLYKALGILQKNIFADSADEATLIRFGLVKLGRTPFPAQAGKYIISVTGDIGAVIEAGTLFKSNDDTENPEKLFILDAPYTLVASSDQILVRALEAGLDSKMNTGEQLTATIPIVGVDRTVVVVSEDTAPLAAEDIENYRDKVLQAFRTEANGGSPGDFRLWAADAPGARVVYPFAKSGFVGEVNLYVEATIADSVDGKGAPGPSILADVAAVIEFDPDTTKPLSERGRRPMGVFQVNYLPITPLDINVTIPSYLELTAEIQSLIEESIEEMVSEIRPFVAGADVLANKNDILDTNKIAAAIIQAKPGSTFGAIILNVNGSPVQSFTFTFGNIPYLNNVAFT